MSNLITILGPTATGKTVLAANLAFLIDGEIISADSRQVYTGMDIGTGKDISDYIVNSVPVPYQLIDIRSPGIRYNVFNYLSDFSNAYDDITGRNKIPVLCGGSGMYLDAVLRGYQMSEVPNNSSLRESFVTTSNEELVARLGTYGPLHNISDISDRERLIRAIEIADFQMKNPNESVKLPEFNSINFGVFLERNTIRKRITERLEARLEEGMVQEVEQLLNSGINADDLVYYGLEYKFITWFVTGRISYQSMFEQLNTAIHQFAKKQMTWYRRMEKKGVKINWIDGSIELVDKLAIILKKVEH
jgi:tRNA dimethylallyltransferase